jgi:hypothetical protein
LTVRRVRFNARLRGGLAIGQADRSTRFIRVTALLRRSPVIQKLAMGASKETRTEMAVSGQFALISAF